MLHTFIERSIIHKRTAKHSKTATQQIDIYFCYIGEGATYIAKTVAEVKRILLG